MGCSASVPSRSSTAVPVPRRPTDEKGSAAAAAAGSASTAKAAASAAAPAAAGQAAKQAMVDVQTKEPVDAAASAAATEALEELSLAPPAGPDGIHHAEWHNQPPPHRSAMKSPEHAHHDHHHAEATPPADVPPGAGGHAAAASPDGHHVHEAHATRFVLDHEADDSVSSSGSVSRTDSHRSFKKAVSFTGNDVADPAPANAKRRLSRSNEVSMKKIVDQLYEKVLTDPELSPFYDGIDMVRLKNQQAKLMFLVFGGAELLMIEDPSLDLRRIHTKSIHDKGLGVHHWEAFVRHFEVTLESMPEIPEPSRHKAVEIIHTTKDYFRPLSDEERAEFEGAGCPFHHMIMKQLEKGATAAGGGAAGEQQPKEAAA